MKGNQELVNVPLDSRVWSAISFIIPNQPTIRFNQATQIAMFRCLFSFQKRIRLYVLRKGFPPEILYWGWDQEGFGFLGIASLLDPQWNKKQPFSRLSWLRPPCEWHLGSNRVWASTFGERSPRVQTSWSWKSKMACISCILSPIVMKIQKDMTLLLLLLWSKGSFFKKKCVGTIHCSSSIANCWRTGSENLLSKMTIGSKPGYQRKHIFRMVLSFFNSNLSQPSIWGSINLIAKWMLCKMLPFVASPKTRWWFQIFFIFTPNLGEDSHFD